MSSPSPLVGRGMSIKVHIFEYVQIVKYQNSFVAVFLLHFSMPSLRDRSTRKMIRLAYHGCANRPFYHFVVQLNRAPRNQKPIEQIGTYDPLPNVHKERLVAIDFDRLKYWYAYRGASLSKPVLQLLGRWDDV